MPLLDDSDQATGSCVWPLPSLEGIVAGGRGGGGGMEVVQGRAGVSGGGAGRGREIEREGNISFAPLALGDLVPISIPVARPFLPLS